VGSTLGMTVGQVVSGIGIAGGSVILRILDENTVEISNPVTSTGQNNITFGVSSGIGATLLAGTTSGSASVTVPTTLGLSVGQAVTGPGIPVGATVAAILSDTEILISVAALYTGSNSLVFAGMESNLGASRNAQANLVFNGGVLQYNGTNGSTDRGFSINEVNAIWDVGNAYTQLTVGGNWGTPGIEDNFKIVKRGSGTLELLGTFISGHGVEDLVIEGGTLLLRPAFSNQYVRTENGGRVVL
jgi:fibronectin-binding autotransporter adhesin